MVAKKSGESGASAGSTATENSLSTDQANQAPKKPQSLGGGVQQAPAEKAPVKKTPKPKAVEGIHVKTIPGLKSFRRAGFGFNQEGISFTLDALSEEQLEALENEPHLVITHCTLELDKEYVGKT